MKMTNKSIFGLGGKISKVIFINSDNFIQFCCYQFTFTTIALPKRKFKQAWNSLQRVRITIPKFGPQWACATATTLKNSGRRTTPTKK